MGFELLGHWRIPLFFWPGRWEIYIVLAVYLFLLLFLLVIRFRDFTALGVRKFILFLALSLSVPLFSNLFVLRLETIGLPPPPYLAVDPVVPAVPVLGLLPLIIAVVWMGVSPALAVGFLVGFFRAGSFSHNPFEPFDMAFFAALSAYLLRQDYRDRLLQIARQPLCALPVAFVLTRIVAVLSTFFSFYRPDGMIAALDYALTVQREFFLPGLVETLVYGLLLQLIYLISPRVRPVRVARRPSPFTRSLGRRFLYLIVSVLLAMTAVLCYAVYNSAVEGATRQAVDSLIRDAVQGANGLSSFISLGYGMTQQFASDPVLWSGNTNQCVQRLANDLQMEAYFERLTAYGPDGEVLCTYPAGADGDVALVPEEQDLHFIIWAEGGQSATSAYRGADGRPYVSFLSQLRDPVTGTSSGVLVGRVELGSSPPLRDVLAGIQGTMGQGEGFVIDAEGRVIARSATDEGAERLFEYWAVDQSAPALAEMRDGQVWVRESRDSTTNARMLVCQVPLEGHGWAVVITLPHEVVLRQAVSLAGPLLGLLIGMSVMVGLILLLVTSQLTRPINLLASAASSIAAGDLDASIHLEGDDEVARLGDAFEKMRVGLKDRLDDLSLLLRVGQEVSAALDLASGMPPLLEGALQATDAIVSRVVLLSAAGEPQLVMGRGESMPGLSVLDQALGLNARDVDRPMVIENLTRARSLTESGALPPKVKAVVALPVRGRGRAVAVMWVGYSEPRRFTPNEIDLLSTLANQTAVLVENARLFQDAEGERGRLAAILTSTSDAVLVTGREGQILLINPAAEQALGLKASEVMMQDVSEVPLEPTLARVLTEPMDRSSSLVDEVPLDGRTFYASASTILGADGENMGRVAVMRDVTHFKELDELKSEFVSTVSHDLRTPLTFMRGYASMMPMVGELNEKQQEYLEKILTGVENMGGLVDDLLDLGRIEAGVGLEESACHLGALVVEATESMRARAVAKGLVINMKASDTSPLIMGDATLLRQAIANLVDNAIKYTPAGGTVSVGLRTEQDEALVIVTDSGMGIAPEDQVRLFEKFFRVRNKETRDIQGTGLGLAIVKSIIERHGGRVRVDSVLNQGSTFTIALPLRRVSPENRT